MNYTKKNNKTMTLLTAIEISQNYPNYILIDATQHKETGKWVSSMYRLKDWVNPLDENAIPTKEIHKIMLSFDFSDDFQGWDTKEDAIDNMKNAAEVAIKYVKEMKR